MGLWSAIFAGKGGKGARRRVREEGPPKQFGGWFYEEFRDFSTSQSTVRIEQGRPGDWETVKSACGIVALNGPGRRADVERFFAGTYRWLLLEREPDEFRGSRIAIVGTYRDKGGKERTAHLGYLEEDLCEEIAAENIEGLWARIRFIRFPVPGRSSKYMIRFDLMADGGLQGAA